MFLQALAIGLVAFVGYSDWWLLGRCSISRPILLCPLVGIVMGDPVAGIKIGASMELALIGVQDIGVSTPGDTTSAAVLGTGFAIATGKGVAAALTFGLPLSYLVLLIKNVFYVFVAPLYVNACDKYAKNADSRKYSWMAWLGGTLCNFVPASVFTFLTFYFGNDFANTILDAVPNFVQTGLTVASGLLPALGFAVLLQQIIRNDNLPYFVLGFVLTAYLKMPIIGVSIVGGVIVALLFIRDRKDNNVNRNEVDNYESF